MDGAAHSAERTPLAAELAPVSTGPRTLAGKVASSVNATRHGLRARSVVLPGIESPEAWEAHRDAVVSSLAPVGAAAVALAERAAELLWRLQRAGAAESALATYELAGAEEAAVMGAVAEDPGESDKHPVNLGEARSLADLAVCTDVARELLTAADLAVNGEDGAELCPRGGRYLVRALFAVLGQKDPVLIAARPDHPGAPSIADWSVAEMRRVADRLSAPLDRDWAGTLVLAKRYASEAVKRVARVEREARRRIALAEGMAAVGPEVEQVRRHEAHMQRQLAGVLAMMAALVTPRAMFVRAMAKR